MDNSTMVQVNNLAVSQLPSVNLSLLLTKYTRSYLKLFLSFLMIVIAIFSSNSSLLYASQVADLTAKDTQQLIREMMNSHPTYKQVTLDLIERVLKSYCDELDPAKIYFLHHDIEHFISPKTEILQQVQRQLRLGRFELFSELLVVLSKRIKEIQKLNEAIELAEASNNQVGHQSTQTITREKREGKYTNWAKNEAERTDRLKDIFRLRRNAILLLKSDEQRERAKKCIAKMNAQIQKELCPPQNSGLFEKTVFTKFIKAFARSLDSQTIYFTPFEAKQFMIHVQQKLCGIGVLLRDDFDGLTVLKIIKGGPADNSQLLKINDKIIAINYEPIIGFGLEECIEMIRGDAETEVVLTILRKNELGNIQTKDVKITRGEVIVEEERFSSTIEPCKDGGVMICLKLHSFYQDEKNSSYEDLLKHILELQQRYRVKGIILDLRDNPGGILAQAVSVAGLFIDKGIVVSIKDDSETIFHMRNVNSQKVWDGPLLVCVNKASASAAEIVAQTLQDWGRALVVGDETTFGKGSFQIFTMSFDKSKPNPKGEYKITRGRYYTVSGKSPQLVGVRADIVIPSAQSFCDIGEKFLDYPLREDRMTPNFQDTFNDLPFYQRPFAKAIYKSGAQLRQNRYQKHLDVLRESSITRQKNNTSYQTFLSECKNNIDCIQQLLNAEVYEEVGQEIEPLKQEATTSNTTEAKNQSNIQLIPLLEQTERNNSNISEKEVVDYQLLESWNIMRDLIQLEASNSQ